MNVGALGVTWGVVGVFALLLTAMVRLALRASEAWAGGLSTAQWGIAAVVCAVMSFAEGYHGFQRSFSPRTAARLRFLRDHPNAVRSLLAPAFAMGFFHATRLTRIRAWALSLGVVSLVLLVRLIAQPWRGIIDTGVVVGLGWGVVSLAVFTVQALRKGSSLGMTLSSPNDPDQAPPTTRRPTP